LSIPPGTPCITVNTLHKCDNKDDDDDDDDDNSVLTVLEATFQLTLGCGRE
jgi:hypothetical protein